MPFKALTGAGLRQLCGGYPQLNPQPTGITSFLSRNPSLTRLTREQSFELSEIWLGSTRFGAEAVVVTDEPEVDVIEEKRYWHHFSFNG